MATARCRQVSVARKPHAAFADRRNDFVGSETSAGREGDNNRSSDFIEIVRSVKTTFQEEPYNGVQARTESLRCTVLRQFDQCEAPP